MIKLLLCGLWVCAVTLIASYAAVSWQAPAPPAAEGDKHFGKLDVFKTRMISVPVIADGAVQGYIMAQFSFTVDATVVKRMSLKPDVIFLDEAFKTLYAGETVDFRNFRKQDLPGISKTIVENINKRFGIRIVEEALIQELNYIPKERARSGGKL